MTAYVLQVWVHLVAAIVLAGYALFWLVMASGLRRDADGMDARDALSLIGSSRWPPAVAPKSLRVPVLGLGWILVLILVASGVLLLHTRGIGMTQLGSGGFWTERVGRMIAAKLILLALFAGLHAGFSKRVTLRGAMLAAILVAAIVCAAAFVR